MEIAITKNELRINMKAREWCKLPYPDHPHGCPNYGDPKHQQCPPIAPFIQDYIDLDRQMYLIVIEFDFAGHVAKFKQKGWTDRQARCVLYWQNGVNKQLENACTLFKWSHPGMITTKCPEAMGVNVIATAIFRGLPIEKKPLYRVFKIALGGYPNMKIQKPDKPFKEEEFESLLNKASQPLEQPQKPDSKEAGTSESPTSGDCNENRTHSDSPEGI